VSDAGHGIDIEQQGVLVTWLRTHGLIGADEEPRVQVLAGGVSNRTVLIERANGAWVVKQALAKLRVQVDWFSSPERIHREADGLRWLVQFAPAGSITPLVFEDRTDHLLGMEAVPQPHVNWKTMLLRGEVVDDHVCQFARLAALIHGSSAVRLAKLRTPFGDRSFFESLRLEPYYEYTAGQVPEAAGFYTALLAETRNRQSALVHGDFSPKNVLVHDGRLVLLDHEVIHLGDPGFDLGFGMTHLLSKAHHMVAHRSTFLAAAGLFWETYAATLTDLAPELLADDLEARAVRHTLGCLLARIRGRSPLEYMDDAERTRQAAVVGRLMVRPPATIGALIKQFATELDREGPLG
jgi:hypothetical protein